MISLAEALDKGYLKDLGLKYGLIYSYDAVQLSRIEEVTINSETLIEARFFNEDTEVHVFRRDDLEAVVFKETEEDKDQTFTENQLLERYADQLIIKNYIDYDKDGQAYIRYSRPAGLIFKKDVNRSER